jgi:hypothetical protein
MKIVRVLLAHDELGDLGVCEREGDLSKHKKYNQFI